MKIGVLGSGAMGSGIAQVAATNGHNVVLVDTDEEAINNARGKLQKILARLVEKGRIDESTSELIFSRIEFTTTNKQFVGCGLIIEAIVERLDVKKIVFSELENIVGNECILATNTSSLSVASIAAACDKSERVIGLHFFNP
ncbi:MAG: NAD(P)-binding domain-containing protein, partial [Flavobacteriales bacterium]|nr:NAD(P)-binding domain-containing protein [Flavobacteriales bacterium]